MASGAFNLFKSGLFESTPFLITTINVALIGPDYNFNPDHVLSDVLTYECSGNNYTQGGVAPGTQAVNQDNTNDRAIFSMADAFWSQLTVNQIRSALIYSPYYAEPLYIFDFGTTHDLVAQDLTIEWNDTDGVLTLT